MNALLKMGISLLLVGVIVLLFAIFADMRPKISPDFFFGSEDPEIAASKEIAAMFPAEEFLVISVGSRDIYSSRYFAEVDRLTKTLSKLPGFSNVISISAGPSSLKAALESPFWRPLLVSQDEKATLVIAFLSSEASSVLVPAAESIAAGFLEKDSISSIHLSGMPYIVEQIRRSIIRDAKLFSTAALLLFAVLIWGLYRSPMIALGASVSGISAIFLTLLTLGALGQPVGILTANLAIIVFVLVQSQVIYLTNNWRRETQGPSDADVNTAVKKTFTASFWCAVTTFLGFLSLLFVSAEPLRQLGVGGLIGVIAALLSCYLIFPSFLLFARKRAVRIKSRKNPSILGYRALHIGGGLLLIASAVFMLPGLFKLNTDPSLFSYFESGGDIQSGLASIDRNGGSSPLQLVVSLKSGARLDSEDAYKKLWNLHKALAAHDQVGTVLSLPALLAEANDFPFAFLLPWREIVTILSLDTNQNVVDNFLSPERQQSLFLLRMKEEGRDVPRASVLEEIERRASVNGFRIDLVGGVYVLQGRLSTLISGSITTGLVSLLGLFLLISFVITLDWRLSLAMFSAASMVPLVTLGGIGLLSVPLDVISAPAVSVTLGLAVDALIHLALAVKRKQGKIPMRTVWAQSMAEQGPGILASSWIICLGFLIFSLSDFPPTTRFGASVIAGALLAAVTALSFFPMISTFLSGKSKQ